MVFGMMAAVSQDLPAIYNFAQYKASKNSEVFDASGEPIGTLTSNQNKILLTSGQISPNVKNAVVSIEDTRFYEHSGVDFQGIGRALVKDILSQSAAQGGSTITEQFVKNALAAQDSRTLFQKFREAALAYRLERHWSKDKILTEYLNTIYFGEGAYGIEAAARTYFGDAHPGCGTPSRALRLGAGALGGGDPGRDHLLALRLRPEVLPRKRPRTGATWCSKRCTNRATSRTSSSRKAASRRCPPPDDIEPPRLDSKAPYFTSWLRQQLVERYGAAKAFFGGLKVKSTLDLRLQGAAEEVGQLLPRLLARDRLGGRDRQPATPASRRWSAAPTSTPSRSTWRRWATASPGPRSSPSSWSPPSSRGSPPTPSTNRRRRNSTSARTARKSFVVTNDEDSYLGSCDIVCATTYSDNSIYAQLALEGLEGKTITDRTTSIAGDDPQDGLQTTRSRPTRRWSSAGSSKA